MKEKIIFISLVFFLFSCSQETSNQSENFQRDTTLTIPHSEEHDAEEELDCVFDRDTVTDAFLKDVPEFGNYTWDEETKEARIVLSNGDSLYIHIGGCLHYGVTATLTRIANTHAFNDHAYWLEQAYWIAENVRGFEPELLHEVDEKKNYNEEADAEGLFIDFHENEYSLIVDRKDGYTHITLNHYFH